MTHAKSIPVTANLGCRDITRAGAYEILEPDTDVVERLQANLIVCVYALDVAAIKAIFVDRHASKLIESLKKPRYYPVHAAIMSNDQAVIRALLEALPAAVLCVQDERGRTPLMCAAELGHADAVKALLEHEGYEEAEMNERAAIERQDKLGDTALISAVRAGHYEVVEVLVERAADVNAANARGECALSLAVLLGHHRIVSLLCAQGELDLSAADSKGVTAVMHAADYAAQTYDSSMLNLLIKRRARTDFKDSDGCTALLRAAKGHSDIAIECLLLAGVGVEAVDPAGCCAVALAAKHSNLYALKYLLKQPNIVVDTKDHEGRTPLYHAVVGGHCDIAYELIKNGANINFWHATSSTTLLAIAKRRGDQAMASILIMHGASDQVRHLSNTACVN